MACSMLKKGVIGATLGAGVLYGLFGTSAPSYLRTAAQRFRHGVKDAMPDQFQIERARDEVRRLEPDFHNTIENLARTSVEVDTLNKEIAAIRSNHENGKVALKAMRSKLDTGDLRLTGNVSYSPAEMKEELGHRLDSYRNTGEILESKEATLKAKYKELSAYRRHLDQIGTAKRALMSKIDGIEARLKMIETTKQGNDFNFDEGALARAKEAVADLEKRTEVLSRRAELEGKYAGTLLPAGTEPGRDVLREMDAEFGPQAPAPAPGEDKSL
ncbi:hypothetical protein TA3x_001969 [Tundrisphaera sp. TA3]|uniref:hypothetical protein n=1 Tax=Tundrisphaera sp. TA3 TaxID=3435775 RepID=UPI003EBB2B0F